MSWMVRFLCLIPALPLLAAAVTALAKRPQRTLAATLAIGSVGVSFLLSCWAFAETLGEHAGTGLERQVFNFDSPPVGDGWLEVGWAVVPHTGGIRVLVTVRGVVVCYFRA